jgi:hypothetical protein
MKKALILAVALLLPRLALAQTFQCSAGPTLNHGFSLGLTEVSPSQPNPIEVAPGAGYMMSAGFCPFTFMAHSYTLLDVGGQAIGSIISPAGVEAGALQFGPLIGTLNNMFAVSLLTQPITTAGTGWAQGGPLKNNWGLGLTLNLPLNTTPTSPPVGMPSEGAKAFPKGTILDLVHAIF